MYEPKSQGSGDKKYLHEISFKKQVTMISRKFVKLIKNMSEAESITRYFGNKKNLCYLNIKELHFC